MRNYDLVAESGCSIILYSNRLSSFWERETYALQESICLTFPFPGPTLGSDPCAGRNEQLPKRRDSLSFSSGLRSSCPSSYLPTS